jgi:hypothetical protein
MRLYTTLAVTAAAAAVTFNFWLASHETVRAVIVNDMQPVLVDADDDLTVMLRQQARTAMLALQRRQQQDAALVPVTFR